MRDASLAIEYENGVADVLAFLAGNSAVVDRDVKLPGGHSGVIRQVDVRARGRVFGMADATLMVDCKRWGKPVDVGDAGAFVDRRGRRWTPGHDRGRQRGSGCVPLAGPGWR